MPSAARYTRPVLSESVGATTATAGVPETVSRPKVMRRPATFSTALSPSKLPFEPAANVEESHATNRRDWQDDSRFGMALMVTVLVVNLLLALVFSSPVSSALAETMGIKSAMGEHAPTPRSAEPVSVTIYAPSAEDDAPPVQLLDYEQVNQTLPTIARHVSQEH
jgi:hypothetical protein